MSVNKPPANETNNDKKPKKSTGQSDNPSKKTSPGFIDTSGFKPNWLETGPLSPEILQELENDESQEPVGAGKIEPHTPQQSSPEMSEGPQSETDEPSPLKEDKQEAAPTVSTEGHPFVTLEAEEEQPEAWVQALFERDRESGRSETKSSTLTDGGPYIRPAPSHPQEFIESPAAETRPEQPADAPQSPLQSSPPARQPTRRSKKRDGWTPVLFLFSLALIGIAAFLYVLNPLSRLAMDSGTLAEPKSAPPLAAPQTGSSNWCVQGEFLNEGEQLRLSDSGTQGDILAGDGVFSLDYIIPNPGNYKWNVVDCDNSSLKYPEPTSWLNTTEPNHVVTLVFDVGRQNDALFNDTPFVVSAIDSTDEFRVVGSFQDWDIEDNSARMSKIADGLYQQSRRIARPGNQEAYFLANGWAQTIDAFGRTDSPIAFTFRTQQAGEYVVFLIDTYRGRASIHHGMSPGLAALAFTGGHRFLTYLVGGLGILLFLIMLLRLVMLNNKKLRMESGCPQCGQPQLIRVSRRFKQRLLNMIAIPAYRYRCRNCTWEGTRLSDAGEAISPGALFTRAEDYLKNEDK